MSIPVFHILTHAIFQTRYKKLIRLGAALHSPFAQLGFKYGRTEKQGTHTETTQRPYRAFFAAICQLHSKSDAE